jgi:hypothetical protein
VQERQARVGIGVVLAVSVGIGAYLGSAQLAGSTPNAKRTVTLRVGDAAVFGRVRCLATSDSRSEPMRPGWYYMLCSKRPLRDARYRVDIFPNGATVSEAGNPTPLYTTP